MTLYEVENCCEFLCHWGQNLLVTLQFRIARVFCLPLAWALLEEEFFSVAPVTQ